MISLIISKCLQAFVVAFFISLNLIPCVSYSQTLTFAVNDYCPYYCKDHSSATGKFLEKPGYIIEILDYAFTQNGYQLNYLFVPWERGLVELDKNTMNGIIISSKADAPELIFPEQEQGNSVGCFATRVNSTWKFTNKKSLDEIYLGVAQGYIFAEPVGSYILQANSTENKISFVAGINALSRLLKMVDKGRIDATIDDQNVLLYKIKKDQLQQNIKISACIKNDVPLYVAFSPTNLNSIKYANILSNAMIKLRASGELTKILAKYNLSDWQ